MIKNISKDIKRKNEFNFASYLVAFLFLPIIYLLCKIQIRGAEKLKNEPYIFAVNHITKIDPFLLVGFMWKIRRMPHFLAKDGLFKVKGLRGIMKSTGQIPVYRSSDPIKAFKDASAWLKKGHSVIIYPEGTLTDNKDLWPKKAMPGVSYLAKISGAKVVCLSQWGAQNVLPPRSKRLKIFPKSKFIVSVGKIYENSAFSSLNSKLDYIKAADNIMQSITQELKYIRGCK